MDIVAIVFTVCTLAHPDQCEERRIEYFWHGSLRACVQGAQPYLAQWAGEHPNWTIKRYHCEFPSKRDKADARGAARPA
jgi:hypothetical protein